MIKQLLDKINTRQILDKLVILLILASFVNILVPYHSVLAKETIANDNRANLGIMRQTKLFNPDKVPVTHEVAWSRYITVTAYNSEVGQTDGSPFTTANGSIVHDGVIAANFLRHGTKVRFPEYFGDKIFEVKDRMNRRYYYRADIWMEDKPVAKQFGRRTLKIEILNEIPQESPELTQAK
ncbi:3D domain-containing protein [Candidatus Falkowbacteria bacterium]|nr:3D domain-containing protein [Candidatus Falkowbacteria bacterium]